MENSSRFSDIFLNDPIPEYTWTRRDSEPRIETEVVNRSVISGFPVQNTIDTPIVFYDPMGALPIQDHVDAISRHITSLGNYESTLSVVDMPTHGHSIRNHTVSPYSQYTGTVTIISCGFDVFDGYLVYSAQGSWFSIKIEVIHKPPQKVLDLILKIYEGSRWEDRIK